MRGTHSANSLRNPWSGIIPAYAGNTRCRTGFQAGCGDHPRVCGEHQLDALVGGIRTGSSPRMRGTPLVVWGDSCDEGIIPAYAGNTPRAAWTPRSCRDHPRVCGEHVSCSATTEPVVGSSPRMRGTRFKCARQSSTTGIIPAYAGNTPKRRSVAPRSRDHPRVCGEHKITAGGASTEAGSSPRMRGTHLSAGASATYRGIIPAYAGNTSACMRVTGRVRDHPRVCGEHNGNPSAVTFVSGSSPRMRGTL